jgi:hypothetical protein
MAVQFTPVENLQDNLEITGADALVESRTNYLYELYKR